MTKEAARCGVTAVRVLETILVPGSRATIRPNGAAIVVVFLKPSVCDDSLHTVRIKFVWGVVKL